MWDGCPFVTEDGDLGAKLQHMTLHIAANHAPAAPVPVAPLAPAAVNRSEKAVKPVLEMQGSHCSENSWRFFKFRWGVYKGLMNIPNDRLNASLQDCLPTEVGALLYQHYGDGVANQTEQALLDNLENLVVLRKGKLATIIELQKLEQQSDESAEHYVTKLKDLARQAGFK